MGCKVEDEFPKQTGLYSVTDLRRLAAALGFPSHLLERCLPPGSLCKGIITSKELHRLLDLGYFTSALHFTFNMKSGLYNVKLILKCIDLLDRSALSFAGIQEAKVAFCAYEHFDQKGAKAETSMLLKTIKMCGFVVSSQKLSMYVRQNRPSFVEPGRVQLYEFLDFLTICEPKNKFSMLEERVPSTEKTSRGLYQMDDMRTFMMTPDEKLAHHLNRRFQHVDSWMLPQETMATTQSLTSRKCQRTENLNGTKPQPPKSRSKSSDEETTDGPWTLVTPVPQETAFNVEPANPGGDSPSGVSGVLACGCNGKKKNVSIRETEVLLDELRCHCYTPRREQPIQTEQDIQKTKNNIEELMYEMETLGEKTRWDLNWKLDYYLPGYRERSSSRHVSAVPQPPKTIKKKSREDDVFKRLSAPRKRVPSPCHATSCDAYKLGIADEIQRERLKCSTATLHGSRKSQRNKNMPSTLSAKV